MSLESDPGPLWPSCLELLFISFRHFSIKICKILLSTVKWHSGLLCYFHYNKTACIHVHWVKRRIHWCFFRFSLVKEHLIEFNQLAMANAEGSDQMLNRVMTKDNIGLAALLETHEGVFDSSGKNCLKFYFLLSFLCHSLRFNENNLILFFFL